MSAGVNKLALLTLVEQKEEGVKENHDSLSQLVEECGIKDIDHDKMTWTGDQNAVNDFCRIGNQKSKYPCVYCKARQPFGGEEEANTMGLLREDLISSMQCNMRAA